MKSKWPSDWEYHVYKYCDLYFCDKALEYVDENTWIEVTTDTLEIKTTAIELDFQIDNYNYIGA